MAEIPPGVGRPEVSRSSGLGAADKPKVITHPIKMGSAVADAAGIATLQIGPVPFDTEWYLEHIRIQSDSILASDFEIYHGYIDPANSRDFSIGSGNNDASTYQPALYFGPGETLCFQWTGCTPLANCLLLAQIKAES